MLNMWPVTIYEIKNVHLKLVQVVILCEVRKLAVLFYYGLFQKIKYEIKTIQSF